MTTSNVSIQTRDETAAPKAGGCGCGGCGCGGQAVEPELNIQAIPRQIRHGAVLGALASLAPGEAMVLVAPHEPRRLLAQVDATFPGIFEITPLESEIDSVRVRFARVD